MEIDYHLDSVLLSLAVVIQLLCCFFVWGIRKYVRILFDRISKIHRETITLIIATKDYTRLARINQLDAERAMEEVQPTLLQVPEVTAEKVVEKLHEEELTFPIVVKPLK